MSMDYSSLVEGNVFYGVLGVLVIDPETNRKRVKSLPNQDVPEGLFIECSKSIRSINTIGTTFKINVNVSRKPIGRLYLHSFKKQELLTISEWESKYNN
jgi:hypothetical protein